MWIALRLRARLAALRFREVCTGFHFAGTLTGLEVRPFAARTTCRRHCPYRDAEIPMYDDVVPPFVSAESFFPMKLFNLGVSLGR